MPLHCFHIPPTTLNPSHFHQKSHKILGTHNEKRVLAGRKISHAAHSRISPLWTVDEIAEAVNGTIVQRGPPGPICTDTRTLEPGQWFFAIRGENFDAHEFITPELGHKGCVGVIGNWVCPNWDKGFVEMGGDTLTSLKKMTNYARNKFHGCLVGVTGSAGKTTTRTMIALTLESLGLVHQTHGNENNRIGVCLSLIGIPQNVGFVVLELGMDRRGEIMELARMARPSIRVILNVGCAHLENFASLEEVAMAKGEILAEAKPGDVCVLNADDPLVMSLPVPHGVKKVLFGQRLECDVRFAAEKVHGGHGVRVVLERNHEKTTLSNNIYMERQIYGLCRTISILRVIQKFVIRTLCCNKKKAGKISGLE